MPFDAGSKRAREKVIALLTAREIFDLVRDDLVLVEQELTRQTSAAFEPVSEIISYLLGGGGKRLRPALVLLAARYAGLSNSESAIRLGAVVELLHSATLIHDDVIDSANTRRGRPSANSRWGNHRSVLVGDWLYMLSFQTALGGRNFRILAILIALHHLFREVGQNVQDAEISLFQRRLKRENVQPVAHQDAAMIAPPRIRRRPPAPRVRAVDYVVMNQRGAVQQLDHGAQPDRALAVAQPGVARGKQQQCRAQALAAAAQKIAVDLGNRLERSARLPRKLLLYQNKGVPDEVKNFPGRQQCDDFLPGPLRSCIKSH